MLYQIIDVCIGTTTVTVKVGKKTVGDIKVTVKKNADDLRVSAPETVAAGETFQITFARKGNDTDVRALVAADTENVTITPANEYGTKFDVKIAKAGEFTIKATAFQSATYDKVLLEKDIVIKSTLSIVGAKQTAPDSIKVEFNSPVTAAQVKASNVKAVYTANNIEIVVPMNDGVVSKDGMSVTFKAFAALTKEVEYSITVADVDGVAKVSAADLSAKNADHFVVETTTATYGVDTAITYSVVNAEGIVVDTKDASIVIESIDASKAYVAGDKITIHSGVGVAAGVKFTYSFWYTAADGTYTQNTFSNTFTITSTAVPVKTLADTKWTLYTGAAADVDTAAEVDGVFNASSYAQDTKIAIGETKIFVTKFTLSDGTNKDYAYTTDSSILSVESSDLNTLLVATDGTITPVKTGVAQIIVKQTANGVTTVIGAYPVTVQAARTLGSVTVTTNKNFVNTNLGTDSIDVYVVVKDQYGNNYSNVAVTCKVLNTSNTTLAAVATPSISVYNNPNSAESFVVGTEFAANNAGSIVYEVKATDSTTSAEKTFTFTITAANDTNTGKPALSLSKTDLDTTIVSTKSTADQVSTITYEMWDGNYKTAAGVTAAAFIKPADIVADGYCVSIISPAGKEVSTDANYYDPATGVFNAYEAGAGTLVKKHAVGTYTVRLYKNTYSASGNTQTLVGTKTIVIKDSQPSIQVVQKDNSKNTVLEAFDIYYNGVKLTATSTPLTTSAVSSNALEAVTNGTKTYQKVTGIKVTVTSSDGKTFEVKDAGTYVIGIN